MQQKLIALQQHLAQGMIGREQTIKTALLALLAGENILLIGPPGTGKSMISRRISEALSPQTQNPAYFEYLLTKFSTPEELFGPLSINALKQDRFERHTAGYLPDVSIAFLDEIFKASSSILNSLLTILNEHKFHNGTTVQTVPLQALIAASNELPNGDAELAALYDRFLLRCFVDYLSTNEQAQLFQLAPAATIAPEHQLTINDLAHIRQQAQAVTIPEAVQQAMLNIWQQHATTFKEHPDEQLSDRRFVKAIHLLRVSAATNGRTEADFSDVLLLKDCLWNHADNRAALTELIGKALRPFDRAIDIDEKHAHTQKNNGKHTPTPKAIAPTTRPIKGYQGSGTASDPILIGNLNQLMGLIRPEIGQQGYHFRQTADIDGSAMDTWLNIENFQGTYDGAGHTITYKSNCSPFLFKKICKDSTIYSLTLQHLSLAYAIEGSQIHHCQANHCLANNIKNSQIHHCQTKGNLATESIENSKLMACQAGISIAKYINNTTVSCCQSNSFLVQQSISQSHISDCIVCFDKKTKHYFYDEPKHSNWAHHMGAITRLLDNNSIVERCLVYGEIQYFIRAGGGYNGASLSGMVTLCDNSTIRQSVLGKLDLPNSDFNKQNRIVYKTQNATLSQNVSIDSNQWEFRTSQTSGPANDFNSGDGKSIAAVLLNQDFYEHTLGWDFERIWQWDDATGYPALRSNIALAPAASAAPAANQTSLLTSQFNRNIWL